MNESKDILFIIRMQFVICCYVTFGGSFVIRCPVNYLNKFIFLSLILVKKIILMISKLWLLLKILEEETRIC